MSKSEIELSSEDAELINRIFGVGPYFSKVKRKYIISAIPQCSADQVRALALLLMDRVKSED